MNLFIKFEENESGMKRFMASCIHTEWQIFGPKKREFTGSGEEKVHNPGAL
jgi:hypothetical protein